MVHVCLAQDWAFLLLELKVVTNGVFDRDKCQREITVIKNANPFTVIKFVIPWTIIFTGEFLL